MSALGSAPATHHERTRQVAAIAAYHTRVRTYIHGTDDVETKINKIKLGLPNAGGASLMMS